MQILTTQKQKKHYWNLYKQFTTWKCDECKQEALQTIALEFKDVCYKCFMKLKNIQVLDKRSN